jgi:glycosyltransferase involved in cell wall biosynthesis
MNNGRSTILVVAPLYRPAEAPGAARAGSFVDELARRGWHCRVLTVASNDSPASDSLPLRHTPDGFFGGALARVRLSRLKTTFQIPDDHAIWGLRAIRTGLSVARREKVVAVFSSTMPGTAAVAGGVLARLLRVPHIADFRDPWSFNPYYVWPSRLHHAIDAWLERWVIRNAAAIVCVSDDMADALIARYPQAIDRTHVITNGVEESLVLAEEKHTAARDDFVITTAPGEYRPRQARWPYFFHGRGEDYLTTLDTLVAAIVRLTTRDRVRLRIVGAPRVDIDELNRSGVTVEAQGRLPRCDFLNLLRDSDLLYLPGHENPHIHARGISIPTRLYEYLAAGRSVVVTAGEGATRTFAAQQIGAKVLPPADIDALAAALELEIDLWIREGRQFYPRLDLPTREGLAADLADLVDAVTTVPPPRPPRRPRRGGAQHR